MQLIILRANTSQQLIVSSHSIFYERIVNMAIVLGIDLGTNSLGWGLVDDELQTVIDLGSRIFSAGVNDLNDKKEESKNVSRRNARLIRRQYERRRRRKRNLSNVLRDMRMFPAVENELPKFYQKEPYSLRKIGLYEKLSLLEFGRVLYQLNQHRGYKSSRKTSNEEEDAGTLFEGDKKNNKPGINSLKDILASGKYKTIGEYFATLTDRNKRHEIRIRNRYTERSMFVDEFDKLWDAQKQFYPDVLTEEKRTEIRDKIIFFQKPIQSQRKNLGKCRFEPKKFRAPKSYPLSQEWRMLQQLNLLKISGGNRIDEDSQGLSDNEREKIINFLTTNQSLELRKKPTAKDKNIDKAMLGLSQTAIKLLALPPLSKGQEYYSNIEKIDGLKTYAEFAKALGTDFLHKYGENEVEKMWHTIYFAEDTEWIVEYAQKTWNIDKDTALKFADIRPETGYMNVSAKAMRKMLPHLREGYLFSEAAEKAGYNHSVPDRDIEILDELPVPPQLRNPIVNVALGQLRHVVNAIIKHYGKPDIIRVELARDLKKPKQERIEKQFEQWNNQQQRAEITAILIDKFGFQKVTRDDITKYKLWEECKQVCPYTGHPISATQLFNGEVDIEHILPYSKTLDDSYLNKTLCFRYENANKGNRTPYEAYSGNEERFAGIKERIKDFPKSKARRFTLKDLEKDYLNQQDFIQRQLVDTQYISREATKYLKKVCSQVSVSRGGFTAELRHLWGLNSILGKVNTDTGEIQEIKNRDDHRHHAVDAVVIALTTAKMLLARSTWNAHEYYAHRKTAPEFPLPWPNLREQLIEGISNIIVSHKVNKRVKGQMHERTNYGLMHEPRDKSAPLYDTSDKTGATKYFTVRKRLDGFSDTNPIYKIVDDTVRETVIQRLINKGVDEQKLRAKINVKIPKDAFAEPLYMPATEGKIAPEIISVRLKIVASKMFKLKAKNQGIDYNIWVEPGKNHHYAIYETEDKKGQTKRVSSIVSLFEAYQRVRLGKQPITREKGDGSRFLCSLSVNELWVYGKHPDEIDLKNKKEYKNFASHVHRIQKITEGEIAIIKHTYARLKDTESGKPLGLRPTPNTLKGFKVKVNPIGFLERCYD